MFFRISIIPFLRDKRKVKEVIGRFILQNTTNVNDYFLFPIFLFLRYWFKPQSNNSWRLHNLHYLNLIIAF